MLGLSRSIVLLVAIAAACKFHSPSVGSDATTSGGEPQGSGSADAMIDATSVLPCDATVCAAAGGTCNASGHCEIHHAANGGVVCPATLYCDVYCNAATDSCQSGAVDCTAGVGCDIYCGHGVTGDNACADAQVVCPATGPCNVHCVGENACRNHGVLCGGGPCDVQCIGTNACEDNGVQCGGAPRCTADCIGGNACRNEVCTGAPATCTFNCCGTNACGMTCGCSVTNNC